MSRLWRALLLYVAPKGSGKGAPSWTAYGCPSTKNGHVCKRDLERDENGDVIRHRIHSCRCGLTAWAA